jgi:hypothetical protein
MPKVLHFYKIMLVFLLALVVVLPMVSTVALAADSRIRYVDDPSIKIPDISDNLGVRVFDRFLERNAERGDRWSQLRREEFKETMNVAAAVKTSTEVSWWSFGTKVKAIWNVNSSRRRYVKALEARKDYEIWMDKTGTKSSARSRFNMLRKVVNGVGNLTFSPAAVQMSKLVNQIFTVEDAVYQSTAINGWFHPIKKYQASKQLYKEGKVMVEDIRELDRAIERDPIIKVGKVVGKVVGFFQNLFGGNKDNSSTAGGRTDDADYWTDKIVDMIDISMGILPGDTKNNTRRAPVRISEKTGETTVKSNKAGRITSSNNRVKQTQLGKKKSVNDIPTAQKDRRAKAIYQRYMKELNSKNPNTQKLQRLKQRYDELSGK